ncbi:MAG: hypothetical protein FWD25_07050 [Clostridia bacterium]|nr:hypothetical protein [Clostridia bacterium]
MQPAQVKKIIEELATVYLWFRNTRMQCDPNNHPADTCCCPDRSQLDEALTFADSRGNLIDQWVDAAEALSDNLFVDVNIDKEAKLNLRFHNKPNEDISDDCLCIAAIILHLNLSKQLNEPIDSLRAKLAEILAACNCKYLLLRLYFTISTLQHGASTSSESIRYTNGYDTLRTLFSFVESLTGDTVLDDQCARIRDTAVEAIMDQIREIIREQHRQIDNDGGKKIDPFAESRIKWKLDELGLTSDCKDRRDLSHPEVSSKIKEIIDTILPVKHSLRNGLYQSGHLFAIRSKLRPLLADYFLDMYSI